MSLTKFLKDASPALGAIWSIVSIGYFIAFVVTGEQSYFQTALICHIYGFVIRKDANDDEG